MTRTLTIFFLTVLGFDGWATNLTEWRADIQTKQGAIQTLASANIRHPKFLRSQVRHKTTLIGLLQEAGRITADLGPLARQANQVRPASIFGFSWRNESGATEFDWVAIEKVRAQLAERLIKLEKAYPNLRLISLNEDLQKVTDQRSLLEVSALLYGIDAKAFNSLSTRPFSETAENLKTLTVDELDSLFAHLFKKHLRLTLNSLGYAKIGDDVEREFIDKVVLKGLKKVRIEDSKLSQIYLEEVPKAFALLRGGIGFDCSMTSVPFYPLLDSVRVYWIRKSKNPKDSPRGYLLLAEIILDGETIPYVVTINGEFLSAQEGRAALLAAVSKYKTQKVLVHSAAAKEIVNRKEMEEALFQTEARGRPVTVTMPDGWNKIDQVTQHKYGIHYHSSRLSSALLITLNEAEKQTLAEVREIGKFGHYAEPDVTRLDTIDRAFLYADINAQTRTTFRAGDLEALNITEDQARLATYIKEIGAEEIFDSRPMPAKIVLSRRQFQNLDAAFGLKPLDVFRHWNFRTAAQQLSSMSESDRKALFDHSSLEKFVDDLRIKLFANLEREGQVNVTNAVLLFSLPTIGRADRFLADLVTEN